MSHIEGKPVSEVSKTLLIFRFCQTHWGMILPEAHRSLKKRRGKIESHLKGLAFLPPPGNSVHVCIQVCPFAVVLLSYLLFFLTYD